MKFRLDQLLVKRDLAPSRTKAQDMIRAGEVMVKAHLTDDFALLQDPAHSVDENCELRLASQSETLKFVSRAGLKLESALARTKVSITGKLCLDIGQSTGGFTDVLLKAGAREVWGLDVGHDQLHASLRNHPQVKCFENLNVREAPEHPELRQKKFDFVVADLSFISLEKVVAEVGFFLRVDGEALLLVKPQFELERTALNKQGIVKDPQRIGEVEQRLRESLMASKFLVHDFFAAGVKGKDGNQEYFFYIRKS